ncbi:MAG: glycosyl hydrolase [Cycloclasticus sp.]|nr:glycosyl hydrolase [Cycloclasticus sp.]
MKSINFKKTKGVRLLCVLALAFLVTGIATAENGVSSEESQFHRFWPDNLYAVEFVSDKVGFIAGYSGSVFKTEDGGETWGGTYIGVNELIRHMSFVDESNGWAVGHRGSILHTADGGLTWDVQKQDKGNYLRDISFADVNNGWAVGHGAVIWHTSDGGKNWQKQALTGFTGRDLPRLHGVVAKDANSAILVGEFGMIAHTENNGELWLVSYNPSKATLLSVASHGDGAIAVGLDGGVVNIAIATDEQWAEVEAIKQALLAKKEAKARKKAARKKRAYVPEVVEPLPEVDINYFVTKIDSGLTNHLYDVSTTATNEVIVVGASAMLKVSKVEKVIAQAVTESDDLVVEAVQEPTYSVTNLTPQEGFPLPYTWIGGVDVTESGIIWGAGLRGMIVNGNLNDMSFGQKLNIAGSEAVKLISSRWGEK